MTNAILTYSALQHVVSVLFQTKGQTAERMPRAEEYVSFRGNAYTDNQKGQEVRKILLWQRTWDTRTGNGTLVAVTCCVNPN